MTTRRITRTFWQWLKREPVKYLSLASRFDDTPEYLGPPDKHCHWCDFCPHTTHAHHINLLKHHLMVKAFNGDKYAGKKLDALRRAEAEYK